ncbi:MAG: tetratricopeptide repeat protein, partial [Gemmataceae bacterium]|nr:tetratricopeptide repeat protein [Gemmataceae bacterium]
RRAVQRWAGAVAAVLLLGVVGTTAGLVRADRARRDAERDRHAAEAKEAEANAVVAFLEERVLAAARPRGEEGGLGYDVTVRGAVVAGLPALAAGFADRPLVEARLRETLGRTFQHLGDIGRAVEQGERARDLYAGHLGPEDPTTLTTAVRLATYYGQQLRHDEAVRLAEGAVAALEQVLPPDHPSTLEGLVYLAIIHEDANRFADVLRLKRKALAGYERTLPADDLNALWCKANVAITLAREGRHEEAIRLQGEVLAVRRRVLDPTHPRIMSCLYHLAVSHAALGRHAEALAFGREALDGRRAVLPPHHPHRLRSLRQVAESLVEVGRGAEAVPLIGECAANAAGTPFEAEVVPPVLGLLRKAAAAGSWDRGRIEADADLAPLRGRADFRELVGSLPYAAPPPRPKP